MVAERIGTSDLLNIGVGGKLEVILPDYLAVCSTKALVSRCNLAYPREDGLVWRTTYNREKKTLTIYLTEKPQKED